MTSAFQGLLLGGRKCLMTASVGGHLRQLVEIGDAVGVHRDSLWVASQSAQSRSLLRGRRVLWTPYVGPRDARGVLANARLLARTFRQERFEVAVSTGAAPAVPALVLQRLHGGRAVYIESFSRFRGPSFTGKIVGRTPGVATYTQHAEWADAVWPYAGSMLDLRVPETRPIRRGYPRRLLVTLGTIKPYRFDALVDHVLEAVSGDVEVVWQTGATSRKNLPGVVHEYLGPEEMLDAMRHADFVISHAGVGTALDLLDSGTPFMLVPRRAARGEHVDDHQEQVAGEFNARGLACAFQATDINRELLNTIEALSV